MSNSYNLKMTIEALASFPRLLEDSFRCFAVDHTNWSPSSWDGIPSEKLTAIEQICHVLDVELEGYKIRFERIQAEIDPVLPDLPGEQMAIERNYADYDVADVLLKFAKSRADTVEAIKCFTQEELDRIGIFEHKRTTLAGMVHFLCSHDYQHLSGMQWLLAKLEQERSLA